MKKTGLLTWRLCFWGSCLRSLQLGPTTSPWARGTCAATCHRLCPLSPEHMDLKGTVKLEVEIAPNGKVSSVKPLGDIRCWSIAPAEL
jgi:hypothetical protein